FTRNAISEMRERISYRTSDAQYPYGLEILTLDSLAWQSNRDFNMEFESGSYSHSLTQFSNLLDEGDPDFLSWFSQIKHVFIDEAQDVVDEKKNREPRKEICLQIIDKIEKTCGVSIYGDEAQQIFPFKRDEEDTSLLQVIDENRKKNGFERIELNTVHRTNDQTLINIIDSMRTRIMVYDSSYQQENPIQGFEKKDLGQTIQASTDNYLFLFWANKEIVEVAHNMMESGQNFRFNSVVGKFDDYYPLWLSLLIGYCEKNKIQKIEKDHFKSFSSLTNSVINL
ncbi:uncharacterized protein METZ01_LOCUS402015, partial [marine metagenome]